MRLVMSQSFAECRSGIFGLTVCKYSKQDCILLRKTHFHLDFLGRHLNERGI